MNLQELTDYDFENLVCTGLQGIKYWGCVSKSSLKQAQHETGINEYDIAISKHLLWGNKVLIVTLDGERHWLTADKLCQAEITDELYELIVSGQYDVEDADLLFQVAIFKDIVYG